MKPASACAAAAGMVLALLGVGACSDSSGTPAPKPSAHSDAPILDKAPYWCFAVPRNALQAIDGTDPGSLKETYAAPYRTGGKSDIRSRCQVGDGLLLMTRDINGEADRRIKLVASDSDGTALPADLGRGAVSGSGTNWQAYAYFRCGGIRNLFQISVSHVSSGRDHVADLTKVMRIAQQQYARQSGCTVSSTGAGDDA